MLHFFWVGWWVVGVWGVCVGVWGGGGGGNYSRNNLRDIKVIVYTITF